LMRQRDQEFRSSAGQFFSPMMLDRLQLQKDLLAGRDAEVSVLFCDIRSFSKVSHTVGPTIAIAWVNDILTYLSECVLRYDGVLVDYVGDELMAMFGAPEEQPDHAERACRAAVDMMRLVSQLDAEWREQVQEEFGICIGINSGLARVGNIGSRLKFKYGPLGSTVNVASRIERLAKSLKASAVIGGATAAKISTTFVTRHLTAARVAGISDPIDLHELLADDSVTSRELCTQYEAAYTLLCDNRLVEANEVLDKLLLRFPGDGPSSLLRNRAVRALASPDQVFNAEWVS
jgi:adenylate cyclase